MPPMMHRVQVSVQRFPGPDGETATQLTVSAVPEGTDGRVADEAEEPSADGAQYAVLSDGECRVRRRPDSVLYEVSTTFDVWASRESWLADEAPVRTVPVRISLPLWDLPRMYERIHAQMKVDHGGPVEEWRAA